MQLVASWLCHVVAAAAAASAAAAAAAAPPPHIVFVLADDWVRVHEHDHGSLNYSERSGAAVRSGCSRGKRQREGLVRICPAGSKEGATVNVCTNTSLLWCAAQGQYNAGYRGDTDARTPHIDALAAQGLVLERFYVHKWCAPTRSSLMVSVISHMR
jgi:hypothetical protein